MLDNTPMQDQQYPPYHMPGRWYKVEFAYDNDNSVYVVTKSDLPDAAFFSLGGLPALFCGHSFFPVDFKVYIESNDLSSLDIPRMFGSFLWHLDTSTTGFTKPEFAISLGNNNNTGMKGILNSGTFYVFGYFMP